jgi:hypothetical protein
MMVQSPLELYTTFLGLRNYDLIWKVCTRFGIAYLPFLMLMINSLTKPFETAIGNGADISFRRTFIEFILMSLVCYLAVSPVVSLDVKEIKYQSVCESSSQVSTPGDTGTTYDDMFQGMIVDTVKVPVLLGLALDVSSGITYAITKGMPCAHDINKAMRAVVTTRFSIPLRNSISHFDNQCYLSAKTMFKSRRPDPSSYKDIMAEYGGTSDLSWMGSHVLSSLYYGGIRASHNVPPFPYDLYPSPLVDHNIQAGLQRKPEFGFPTCKEWWGDSTYGLEKNIVDEVTNGQTNNRHRTTVPLTEQVVAWLHKVHAPTADAETANDVIARWALYDMSSMDDGHIDTGGGVLRNIANLGLTLNQIGNNVFKEPMDQAKAQDMLPIMQAILIFLILMFYPFIMIASNYNLKALSGIIFLLFSLIFTTAIWHALGTLRENINNSLSYVNFSNPEEKPLFNNFFTILYYVVPLGFNSLIAGAGVMLGDKLERLTNTSTKSIQSAGSSGASGGSSSGNSSGSAGDAAELAETVPLL